MANSKISALTAATTPLAGTEVLPIVQSSATVKVATNDLTVRNVRANATTGILQVTGPTAGTTRVMTTPDANFTSARTDTGQTFTGAQNLENGTGTNQRLLYLKQANDYGYAFNIDSNTTGKLFIKAVNAGVESNYLTLDRSTYDFTVNTGNLIQGTAAKGINFTANTPAAGMTSQLLNWYEEGSWTPTDASGAGLSLTITYAKYVRVGKSVTVNAFVTYPATASAAAATIGGLPFNVASHNYPPVTFANNSGTAISGFANAAAKTISIGTAANYSASVANSVLSGKVVLISLTYLVD